VPNSIIQDPLGPTALAISLVVSALLFVVAAFFTRAAWKRIAGVLVGALPVVPLVMFYDRVAAGLGWWHYPAVGAGSAPIIWYIAAALGYGAAMGLVGWRVIRRFGVVGLIAFLVAATLLGVTRDYSYSLTTNLIVFGTGPIPLLADLFSYGSAAAFVQAVMYWIAGAPASDRLARTAAATLG
jgi:hypothetical protein